MNRCAVIGCGWAGRHHMETAAESAFAELAAVVDPDENKRQAASERYGIPDSGGASGFPDGIRYGHRSNAARPARRTVPASDRGGKTHPV